jgi:hypothetical protein
VKTLLIPEKADAERLAVAEAWQKQYGQVMKIGRFWDLPELDTEKIALYGNDTFCLVIAEKLGLHLDSPDEKLLIIIDKKWLKREIEITSIKNIQPIHFPIFIKSVIPKQFKSKIYQNWQEWEKEIDGLYEDEQVYCSEIIEIDVEARFFIAENQIVSGSFYEGNGDFQETENFVKAFLNENQLYFPQTVVLDFGYNLASGYFLIEANAVWGAGLNGCNPEKVIECIKLATRKI